MNGILLQEMKLCGFYFDNIVFWCVLDFIQKRDVKGDRLFRVILYFLV